MDNQLVVYIAHLSHRMHVRVSGERLPAPLNISTIDTRIMTADVECPYTP